MPYVGPRLTDGLAEFLQHYQKRNNGFTAADMEEIMSLPYTDAIKAQMIRDDAALRELRTAKRWMEQYRMERSN